MTIRSFSDCISEMEKKNRTSVYLVSIVIWGLLALTLFGAFMGGAEPLIFYAAIGGIGWLVNVITAEYQARMIRAIGARVTEDQFPEVYEAYEQVRARFGVREDIPIVIIEAGSVNALAIKFARKKMIVLFSELINAVKDNPQQLRFFLAHELCHCILDHGSRRFLELHKPAKFKRGRELTCDNAGVVAAGSSAEAVAALGKATVGKELWGKLHQPTLEAEAKEIMSGFSGWMLSRHLTHPACGERMKNAQSFAAFHSIEAQQPPVLVS
jgi:Zn-dependent protease with chaperone function